MFNSLMMLAVEANGVVALDDEADARRQNGPARS
jgi:hypothetical protein